MNSNLILINEHLIRVFHLIRIRATGIRSQFACKMGLSERTIDNLISQLRQMGAPIAYCHYCNT